MTDICLVHPAEPVRIFDPMVPLGMASVGTVLKEAGFSVQGIDLNGYRGDFKRTLLARQPKIVGIGGTTPTRLASFRVAETVKDMLPSALVVYGGVHATFAAEDTLRHVPAVDYVIAGEGEYAMRSFCNAVLRSGSEELRDIPGLCYRESGTIVCNPPERINNLDALPAPDRTLFDGDYRVTMDFTGSKGECIVTSRGCPAACTFCSASRMFPGGVRYRSLEKVEHELDGLVRSSGVRALKIFDSTFTADRERVLAFCRMIAPRKLEWECEIRADTVDREMLAAMRGAGCYYVDIGMETANPRLLKRIAKGIRPGQVERVLDWCRELGIRTKLFFVFGLPGQSFGDACGDVRYLRRNRRRIDLFATTIGLRVYPGTAVERRLHDNGTLEPSFSWAHYRAPFKNRLLMEFNDTMILFSPGFSVRHFYWIIIRLVLQNTLLTPAYVLKLVGGNIRGLMRFAFGSGGSRR